MNLFTFTGNLGRNAEVRYTKGGTPVCSFSVAIQSGYGDNEKTGWVRCNIFGKRAEGALPQYLVKGAMVAVSGELTINVYTNKNKEEKTSIDINVDQLTLCGGKKDGVSKPQSEQEKKTPAKTNDDFDDDIPF